MAKPNYQFEKRQRDLAKKKKKDEKRLKKQHSKGDSSEESSSDVPDLPSTSDE